MKQIAIIDDDMAIGTMLEEVLTQEGYGVLRAYSGTEALYLLEQYKPDLVLLDLMLPGLSGEELLPKIQRIPVIVLSAKAQVQDKVDLLLGGAADYLTKPFDVRELLARIAVQLRRPSAAGGKLTWGELELDSNTHQVLVAGQQVHLTKTEYGILRILLEHQGQVVTKTVLLDRISRDTPDCVESSLKVHVSNLRKKLRQAGGKDYIETVWGIGFTLSEQS